MADSYQAEDSPLNRGLPSRKPTKREFSEVSRELDDKFGGVTIHGIPDDVALPGGEESQADMRKGASTAPKTILSARRAAEIVSLRAIGASWDQIGRHMECTPENAKQVFKRAVRKYCSDPVEEMRAVHDVRLTKLLRMAWPTDEHADDFLDRIRLSMELSDRIAKLHGLNLERSSSQHVSVLVEQAQVRSVINLTEGDEAAKDHLFGLDDYFARRVLPQFEAETQEGEGAGGSSE